MLRNLISLLLIILPATSIVAQEKLSEGVLTYHITITGKVPTPANEPALTETKSGTLTIYLKEDNVRQDISLEDGYRYSRISNYTTDKDIILQTINTVKYAIEVSMKESRKKNSAFMDAVLKKGKGKKDIAGYTATEAVLQYKDGSEFPLYYTEQYELNHPELFEHAPQLKGLPVLYDIRMSNGFTTHFELKTINLQPVANAAFRVPEGYRIISRKEYEKLIR